MQNKLILRLSNNLGNQMFMYASGYAFSKELNRDLLIDNESSYIRKKNSHTKYNLDLFRISAKHANKNLKYIGAMGHFKRKLYKYLNIFKKKKFFYVEHKSKDKITFYNTDFMKNNYDSNLFIEGYFESEKYFLKYKNEIRKEFSFKLYKNYLNNPLYNDIKNSNSVCVCLRQNRFSEGKGPITSEKSIKSQIFSREQSQYIVKCINIMENKIPNAKFFLWSNDYNKIFDYLPKEKFTVVKTNEIGLDLFLMTQSKHYIMIPSSFNWWGCWLSDHDNKIVLRPSENFFSNYHLNNTDFWPENWIKV